MRRLNKKTVLFQAIQFNINTQFSSIWPTDVTLSGATFPGYSWPGSDGNERVLRIPQSSSITGISPFDCLVSYSGHSAAVQSVYSEVPVDWITGHSLGEVLSLCREAVGVFYSTSRLSKTFWRTTERK